MAADASHAARAALHLARLMAGEGAWKPETVTVFEPVPVSVGEILLPAMPQYEMALSQTLVSNVRREISRHGSANWSHEVRFGRVPSAIVDAARDNGCELIVLGLGQHNAVARLFGAETAERVARRSPVPVLAVHPAARKRPRTALAAIDFGESSICAAEEALRLLRPPARLHLVHVKWGYNFTSLRDSDWDRAYTLGVDQSFARLRKDLGAKPGLEITCEALSGPTAETLLGAARSLRADLISVGSHGRHALDRLIIGSTPSFVLRAAAASVLIAPPVSGLDK